MGVIETDALTRRFGAVTAVGSVTITVAPGDVFGLLGPNGAGKSTLVKMLTTLLPPTAGAARVAGFDVVSQAPDVRREIGYVPQALSVDGTLTGYEGLALFARLYDVPRDEREPRVRAALAFMGLADAAGRLVRTYSGGMIRRLEIAQAVLHRPPVLFLDEPTVGLDPLARDAVWDHLRRLCAEAGTTIFLTTHYMEEADALCSDVAIMHRGAVAAVGRPADLKTQLGGDGVTLDDVFVHYAGDTLDSGGTYDDTARTRRTARRLG